jgi:hypothetical protein
VEVAVVAVDPRAAGPAGVDGDALVGVKIPPALPAVAVAVVVFVVVALELAAVVVAVAAAPNTSRPKPPAPVVAGAPRDSGEADAEDGVTVGAAALPVATLLP